MKLNENTKLVGDKVIFVPYTKEHVEKYHIWMKDPFLQEMTCSEPLSIEEEYEMQQTWHLDDNKLTFILLDKEFSNKQETMEGMCGDINIFISENDENETIGEIEIMIAEEKSRKKGIAKESIKMMIKYANEELKINKFIAKIIDTNQNSIILFKKLGFKELKYVSVFNEYHFVLDLKKDNFEFSSFIHNKYL
eukprot:gene10681-3302_t